VRDVLNTIRLLRPTRFAAAATLSDGGGNFNLLQKREVLSYFFLPPIAQIHAHRVLFEHVLERPHHAPPPVADADRRNYRFPVALFLAHCSTT
jgi:hypothetical protein